MKKVGAFLGAMFLLTGTFSGEVFAGGNSVFEGKPYVYVEGDYHDLWKPSQGTGWNYDGNLTLTLNGYDSTGIEFQDLSNTKTLDCRIVLKGFNNINDSDSKVSNGIYTNNDNLFIDGPGELKGVYHAYVPELIVENGANVSLDSTFGTSTYVTSNAVIRVANATGTELSENLHIAGTMYADSGRFDNHFDYPQIAKSGAIICTASETGSALYIPTVYYGETPHNLSGYQFFLQDGTQAIASTMGGDVLDSNNKTAHYVKLCGSQTFAIRTWKTTSGSGTQTDENNQTTKKIGTVTYSVKGNTAKVTKIDANTKVVTIPSTINVNGRKVKVVEIGAKACYRCTALNELKISANVSIIGENAFYGCKNLKKITILSKKLTDKNIGKLAFKGINAKAVIQVPKGKVELYKGILKKKGIGKKVKFQ